MTTPPDLETLGATSSYAVKMARLYPPGVWEAARTYANKLARLHPPGRWQIYRDAFLDAVAWRDAHPEAPAPNKDAMVEADGCHGLDTPERVRFYEHDFYPLSNFSAFRLRWRSRFFDTVEHAYHYEKFPHMSILRENIKNSRSAHEAFKTAEAFKSHVRPDWDDVKISIMEALIRAKVDQHEYVKRKLLATGDRELVEDSWRDDFWGWGPNRDGKNMLGKLWMELRASLKATQEI